VADDKYGAGGVIENRVYILSVVLFTVTFSESQFSSQFAALSSSQLQFKTLEFGTTKKQ
jgi:hypothetical protein